MRRIGLVETAVVAVAGAALGWIAVRTSFPLWQVYLWMPDLLTGWVMIGAGLVGLRRSASSRTCALVVFAGFSWYLGDFASLGGVVGFVAVAGMFLHRGILFHALITVPSGRTRSPFERGAVIAAYGASVIPAIWIDPRAASLCSVLFVGALAFAWTRAPGVLKPVKGWALAAMAGVALAIVAGVVVRHAWAAPAATATTLIGYEIAVAVAAVTAAVLGVTGMPGRVAADLVIEIRNEPGRTLQDALRWAVDDPSLTLAYIDTEGPADGPGTHIDGSGREQIVIAEAGQVLATIEVAPGVLDDAELRESVRLAVQLDAVNRRLRADVMRQLRAVQDSHLRLVRAGDEESRDLEARLRSGPGARLDELAALLAVIAVIESEPADVADLESVSAEVSHTRDELIELARGYGPRSLGERGLEGALALAVLGAPMPVVLAVDAEVTLPPEVEVAIYYFCLEALTNVIKHADAAHASISMVSHQGLLRVEIQDDGVGGVALESARGVHGAAERICAIGGVVAAESTVGEGTRLIAEIPLASSVDRRAHMADAVVS